jgi:hypothetical protein
MKKREKKRRNERNERRGKDQNWEEDVQIYRCVCVYTGGCDHCGEGLENKTFYQGLLFVLQSYDKLGKGNSQIWDGWMIIFTTI